MDYSKPVIFAACGAFVVSGYLIYQLSIKEDEIKHLKQEINRLNIHINELKVRKHSLSISPKFIRSSSGRDKNDTSLIFDASFTPDTNHNKSKDVVSDLLLNDSDEEFFDTHDSIQDTSYKYLLEDIQRLELKGDLNYPVIYKLLSEHDFKTAQYYCLKAKFSRYMARIEEENENDEKAKHYYFEETLDPEEMEVKKWCAITLGDITEFVSLAERIKNAMIIKHYAETSLMIQKDPLVYHLLGRWHFKVALLSWFEIRAARALCSEFPSSTLEKALDYFIQAECLKPDYFINNLLYIAKCHLAMKNPDKETAFYWLQKANRMQTHNYDERKGLTEVKYILRNEFSDYELSFA